ncbi:N-acetyltransferase [Acidisoma sp. 7E03]
MTEFEFCLAMDGDPLVTQFIPGPWHDLKAHRAFVEMRIRYPYPPGMGYWSLSMAESFIGWVFLAPEALRGPDVEIGWRLVRSAWGRGFATEAVEPVLQHAFQTVGLTRVVADIDPHNGASVRVATKLGFRPAGPVSDGEWVLTRYVVEHVR